MAEPHADNPSPRFRLICWLLLIFGLATLLIYVRYFTASTERFATTFEHGPEAVPYAEYVAQIPGWAIGAGFLGAVCRVIAATLLFFRRGQAQYWFVAALIFLLVALFRAFILADAFAVMGVVHLFSEAVILGVSLFAIWFTVRGKAAGYLR